MRITLLRHGEPAFRLGGIVRAGDLKDIARSYDAAGIVGEPPPPVIEVVQGHKMVICSGLPRSQESARALGFSGYETDPLFDEAAMPHFSSGSFALPVGGWLIALRLLWLLGFSRNGESFIGALARARQGAEKLAELAGDHGEVLLIGHGLTNYLIARALRAQGWEGPANPGRGYWEYGVYTVE
ncbi:MAG: histidine phosphatase family protein [Zoogloea oleivorans]|jgi:broad specificity phosphatase PhoE|uniref:histidine phosphatase family protein n=1 Tax=Zoogloea oleivorans TaxID=1552750 RepID=UPI002A36B489|nr:histidine phosphatase family protein [Zoogloea oleivorans]MDY0036598.1 histidine phosphatase family protein [Zoogloea oleivorans]